MHRSQRRREALDRKTAQRKTNLRYQRSVRQEEFDRETRQAQERVLMAGPEHPMYQNVARALGISA